jgi:hypothetical protein
LVAKAMVILVGKRSGAAGSAYKIWPGNPLIKNVGKDKALLCRLLRRLGI